MSSSTKQRLHFLKFTQLVLFEALGNALSVITLFGLLAVQAVGDRDVAPLEVVSDGHGVLSLLGAGRAEEENATHYTTVNFFGLTLLV